MPRKPLRPCADVLDELEETLTVVRVRETRLLASDAHVHGLCEYGSHTVHVDPRPAVVETLVHELLHARWPSWSERRVDREANRLVSGMDDADVRRWWRLYQKAKRVRKRPLRLDAE